MAISDQINSLIEQVKQHPNGETRNSLLGRLKDARAHAFVLEREEFMAEPSKSFSLEDKLDNSFTGCTCPAPGVTSTNCPIHSK